MAPARLSVLRHAGLTAQNPGDGRLLITPPDAITDEMRGYIREHKEEILSELEAAEALCPSCVHLRRPGASAYCSARQDLPFAYGPTHPLRLCPSDGGRGCSVAVIGHRWR